MGNRKIILDGISYHCFTDEELKDSIKEREEKYGVKF